MKRYVYLTKEEGLLIAHHMMAENRLDVKEKTGVCIDNVYSNDLLIKVNNWLGRNGKSLYFSDKFEVVVNDKKTNTIYFLDSFVEFRNIVSEYRKR